MSPTVTTSNTIFYLFLSRGHCIYFDFETYSKICFCRLNLQLLPEDTFFQHVSLFLFYFLLPHGFVFLLFFLFVFGVFHQIVWQHFLHNICRDNQRKLQKRWDTRRYSDFIKFNGIDPAVPTIALKSSLNMPHPGNLNKFLCLCYYGYQEQPHPQGTNYYYHIFFRFCHYGCGLNQLLRPFAEYLQC